MVVLLVVVGDIELIGIELYFWVLSEMFINIKFFYDILVKCLWELLFFNLGVCIVLFDEWIGIEDVFEYEGGLSVFVEYLN